MQSSQVQPRLMSVRSAGLFHRLGSSLFARDFLTAAPATTIQYNLANKAIITTLPDSNSLRGDYSGSTVTATDQVNRKIKRENDGLGRLIKVTEQDAAGALTQETSYSYSLLDKLTQVNQGGQLRSYKYDAMGRLLYERIPEQSATINDGTGAFWSMKYAYTEFGALATRIDARGVETDYAYDALHRVAGISYNVPTGVAATPPVTYAYTSWGALSSVNVGNEYTESYDFDGYHRPSSVTRWIQPGSISSTYTTSYQYNGGSQLTKLTYPSGNAVNMSYDDRGRLSSLPYDPATPSQGIISDITYNVAGQVTMLKLGLYPSNYVSETYGYDSQRMQLTSQTATKSGGPANGLMNLTYAFQASAGQMGAGTIAGNAGQLMTISGTINSTAESAAYNYDLIGRLVTSNQTSNGSSAQRKYAYDRWGNRTAAWPSVLGGSPIQSVTLQQSGGVPTNQITSVTNSGVTLSYTYDAAGNVINDGVHSYAYDAENRVVSVDGGAAGQYKFDHRNRRVTKIVGASVTHYIWQGSEVIAEHDATTPFGPYGSTPYGERSSKIDYIHVGSRMVSSLSYTHNCTTGFGGAITCTTTSTRRYYLSDRLSKRLVLDGNLGVIGRQAHLPFGEDFGESGTQEKHHFASYDRDTESNLDYAVNRSYLPAVGRFMSADPYRASGGPMDPRSWNRYGHTRNNPVNRIDKLGLDDDPIILSVTMCFGGGFPRDFGGVCPGGVGGGNKRTPLEDTGRDGDGPGGDRTPPPPPINPCANNVVSNPNLTALRDGAVADAKAAFGKSNCSALFQGKGPGKFLDDLVAGGYINFQDKFAKWDGQKWVCKKFSGNNNAAVTSPSLAQVPGSNGVAVSAGLIQINAEGFFVDMLNDRGQPVNGRDMSTGRPVYEPFFGLSDNQVRAAVLLHELLHSMGILGPDEGDPSKIDQTNRDLVNNCIN